MPNLDPEAILRDIEAGLPTYGFRAYSIAMEHSVEPLTGMTVRTPIMTGAFAQAWRSGSAYGECLCDIGPSTFIDRCATEHFEGECALCDAMYQRRMQCQQHIRASRSGDHGCGIYVLTDWREVCDQWMQSFTPDSLASCGSRLAVRAVAYVAAHGERVIGNTGLRAQQVDLVNLRMPVPVFHCNSVAQVDGTSWVCEHQGTPTTTRRELCDGMASVYGVPCATGWPKAFRA